MNERPNILDRKQTCVSCWFFDPERGTCHRFPPTTILYPNDNQHPVIYWPEPAYAHVNPTDWCGEWRRT